MKVLFLTFLMWISIIGLILSVLAHGLTSTDPAMKTWAAAGNVIFGLGLLTSRHFLRDKKDEQTTGESGIEHDFD